RRCISAYTAYMGTLRLLVAVMIIGALSAAAAAQERPAPKDSSRVTIPGCVRGNTLIATGPREGEPVGSNAKPGQRFRLIGARGVLKDVGKQKGSLIEVTGLVRKSQEPGGVSVMGGRVRVGPAMPGGPVTDVSRNPQYYSDIVLDLESWRPLADA